MDFTIVFVIYNLFELFVQNLQWTNVKGYYRPKFYVFSFFLFIRGLKASQIVRKIVQKKRKQDLSKIVPEIVKRFRY